ncbi:MAG: PQQ-binding-like beta-propeller repeat protein [Pirellulales bacterium]
MRISTSVVVRALAGSRCRACVALVVLLAGASPRGIAEQPSWPQFRGPHSRGVVSREGLPDRWSATENVVWKTDIPGRGWSSPIVWGDRVFLTSAVAKGELEDPRKGLYIGGTRFKPPEVEQEWKAYCISLASGTVMWERTVHAGRPTSPIHIKNSYASETPVTDGERVYCCFGNVGIFCFDMDGDLVWERKRKPRRTRWGWGPAASPLLHEGRLYVLSDNEEDSYLLALDARSGDEIWRTSRDEKSNWSTPNIWTNEQRTEIVTAGTGRVRSYDLDGKELWSLKGMSDITIATPFASEGLLYMSSGYVMNRLRPIYVIRPGASGDISLQDGATSNEFIAWSDPKAAPYNPSTMVYDGRLYVLYDRGTIACYDAVSGKAIYTKQRLPNGRQFTSSPWAYAGKVFCLNENGITFVVKAGDQFEVLRTNELEDQEMCLATPAIAGDQLLIRSAERLYCIRQDGPE